MANTIKLKRASGSDPGASDLVVGEVAIRTDTAKLFTKKDDNSVAEIGVTALGDNDVTTSKIADDAVTYAKIQNVSATDRLLGRDSSGAGIVEEIAPSAVRTMLGLATSATTDTTNASNIGSGTLNTARLPTTITHAGQVVIQSTGSGNDVKLDAADAIVLEAGEEEDGGILFRGNSGVDSYRFAKGGQTAIEGFLSFESLSADRTFTFPDTTGTLALTSSDITGNAATATALANARTIAGVSFDGTGNISLNNNAITNGAGYITTVADTTIAPSTIDMEDDEKIKLGAGDDLELFHSGTQSEINSITGGLIIKDTGGFMRIRSDDLKIQSESNENYIECDANGAVQLFHNNAVKFVTSSSGGTITGTLVADGFTGPLTGNVTGNASGSSGSCTGNAATATALANARTIAGVSFDGTANISLNNNAITNGAGYLTSVGTSDIDNNAVTFAKLENVAQDRILGRNNAGEGDCEELTASEVRTLLNVADGATNVTNNNQLTNGAGYITSADGGNAATLDSIDSSQFLRSDTGDTASGLLTISGGMTFASDTKCTANIASLTDGSTITINFTTGIHHAVTLGGNRTLAANNEGSAVGQCGSIFITQDGTGSRTLSYSSDYKFVGGTAPTLSTAANAVDRIDYVIRGDGVVHCAISLDVK